MTIVLQKHLPFAPWLDPRTWRLPGIQPLTDGTWIAPDDAYSGQMALRDDLIARRPDLVHAMLPQARAAANELFAMVMAKLAQMPGFQITPQGITRPDGVRVPVDALMPLKTLGRLVQEDLCILQHTGDEHSLTAAILCFPASWSLREKIGRGMVGIHTPVAPYDAEMAKRVQRMFDAIRPDQPLWRANALLYADPVLHQPRSEGEHRPREGLRQYIRSEKQCLLRLPETGAVVFSIHTYMVHVDDLSPEARAGLAGAGL